MLKWHAGSVPERSAGRRHEDLSSHSTDLFQVTTSLGAYPLSHRAVQMEVL